MIGIKRRVAIHGTCQWNFNITGLLLIHERILNAGMLAESNSPSLLLRQVFLIKGKNREIFMRRIYLILLVGLIAMLLVHQVPEPL